MLGLQDPAFFLYLVCKKKKKKDKMDKKRLAYLREWIFANGIGYKKAIQMDKERDLFRSEMNEEIAAMREDNET